MIPDFSARARRMEHARRDMSRPWFAKMSSWLMPTCFCQRTFHLKDKVSPVLFMYIHSELLNPPHLVGREACSHHIQTCPSLDQTYLFCAPTRNASVIYIYMYIILYISASLCSSSLPWGSTRSEPSISCM